MSTTKNKKAAKAHRDRPAMLAYFSTAQHEAGHVVAARLLGSGIPHRVSTEWQNGSSGHVVSEFTSVRTMAPTVRLALKDRKLAPHVRKVEEANVMTDLAGVVAEEIMSGKGPRDGGGRQDRKTALQRLGPFYRTPKERRSRLKILERRISKLMREPKALRALEFCTEVLLTYGDGSRTFVEPELSEVLVRPIDRILEGK